MIFCLKLITSAGSRLVLALAVILALGGATQTASAQDAATTSVAAEGAGPAGSTGSTSVAREFERRAAQVIKRYVSEAEFSVTIGVTRAPKPPADPYPYLPESRSAAALAAMTPEALTALTAAVELNIELAPRYGAKTKRKLSEILFAALALSPNRGDKVTYATLDIELPTPRTDIEIALLKAEADRRQQETVAAQVKRERDDLKTEVTVAKSDLARVDREAREAKATAAQQAKAAETGDRDQGKSRTQSGAATWRDFAVPGAFALILLGGMLLISRSFGTMGRRLGEGLGGIGQAFESRAASAPAPPTVEAARATAPPVLAQSGQGLESMQSMVVKEREELQGLLDEPATNVLVKYVTELLQDKTRVGKAVSAMELLGQDAASRLFLRLSPDFQAIAVDHMRRGQLGPQKLELMLEAAGEIRTWIFADRLRQTRKTSDTDLDAQLAALTSEDLARMAIDVPPALLPRLLSHLDSRRIIGLLEALRVAKPDLLAKIPEAVLGIPEAEDKPELDRDLTSTIKAVTSRRPAERHRPYLKLYSEIIEGASDELSELMLSGLSSDPTVGRHLKKTIVTYNMLFQAPRDIQEEVLAAMTPKDIAALYAGSAHDAERTVLDTLLNDRKRDIVHDEAQQLSRRGSRQLHNAFKRAREVVCEKLRTMQRDGTFDPSAEPQGTDQVKNQPATGRPVARRLTSK